MKQTAAALVVGVLAVGCGNNAPTTPASGPEPSGPVASASRPNEPLPDLLLTFDNQTAGVLQTGASVPAAEPVGVSAVVVAPEGAAVPHLVIVPGPNGMALSFPDPCDAGPDCLRAILEVQDAGWLSPGTSDFSFGASVRVARDDIRDGGNVMQKGYSTDGLGQWKLQIDRKDGRPTCVIVGTDQVSGTVVRSRIDAADGQWHDIVCARTGGEWSISVDGVDETTSLVAGESIDNSAPLRIGGKNTKAGSDPFFGSVDSVWYRGSQPN